jgi:hypothetical protein
MAASVVDVTVDPLRDIPRTGRRCARFARRRWTSIQCESNATPPRSSG